MRRVFAKDCASARGTAGGGAELAHLKQNIHPSPLRKLAFYGSITPTTVWHKFHAARLFVVILSKKNVAKFTYVSVDLINKR